MIAAFLLVPLLTATCASAATDTRCDARDDLAIVRVDERNRRLFVSAGAERIASRDSAGRLVAAASDYVGTCQAAWGSDWNLSVFSEAKYAGYKSDPGIAQYLTDGSWAAAYLAEYRAVENQLIRFPVIPERRTVWMIPSTSD